MLQLVSIKLSDNEPILTFKNSKTPTVVKNLEIEGRGNSKIYCKILSDGTVDYGRFSMQGKWFAEDFEYINDEFKLDNRVVREVHIDGTVRGVTKDAFEEIEDRYRVSDCITEMIKNHESYRRFDNSNCITDVDAPRNSVVNILKR